MTINTFSLNDAKQYLEDLKIKQQQEEEKAKARHEANKATILWFLKVCFHVETNRTLLFNAVKEEIKRTNNPNMVTFSFHGLGEFTKFTTNFLEFWNRDRQTYQCYSITPDINSAIENEFEKWFPGYKVSRQRLHPNDSKYEEWGIVLTAKE